ncbi:MAG: restriction endonuclease subunit S [Neisseriaceae bacterium]|nr:restriction endonuclease subunit S [Neisseriaceae bacterium]
MQEIEDNFKSNGGKFEEFRIGDLFEIKSNPQLNKDSFHFSANGEYPYFTRTVLNNGFAGYVDYLDEEHKIKGNSLAVGMLGMQFFYMRKDFYAGQFTKTAFPKFKGFNETLAQYFIVLFNKYQKVFQGVLVRDFEELFNDSLIQLPTQNGEIAFDYMEAYIKELEADRVKELEYEKAQQLKAYLMATGFKDYTLSLAEQTALETFEKSIKINNLTQMGGVSHICLLWIVRNRKAFSFRSSKSVSCLRLRQAETLLSEKQSTEIYRLLVINTKIMG